MRASAVLSLALVLTSTAAAQPAPTENVQVTLPTCVPAWFEPDALIRALSVELSADGLRIAPDGATVLAVDASCDAADDSTVTLSIEDATRAVALADLAPSVRMRALALAARDFLSEMRARHPAASAELAVGADAPPAFEPEPVAAEAIVPRLAWLTLQVAARAQWVGTRVVAPALSVELEAQLPALPLSLYVAIDGLYAVGQDVLGEIRAIDVGLRGGARVWLDVDSVRLALGVGALLGYARADASAHAGVGAGHLDGALVGIDTAVSGALAVSRDVSVTAAIGVVGYVVGIEARAETRTLLSFRDPAPWAALGVGVMLDR